jgi:molybdenum cofactor biosynthesis enzyme MoaA
VRQVQELPQPFRGRLEELSIELTERCNNDCIHCCINLPAGDRAARKREMTTEQVKEVLQQAAGLGCLLVHLTGGEPLLRPDFEEIYLAARRLGIKVLLFSNARLITPRLADLFVQIPPLEEIEITVYGTHPESYEAVTRIPGSFVQFKRGVELLWEHRVPFLAKSVVLPSNRAELEEFETGLQGIPWKVARPAYAMEYDLRNRRDDPGKNQMIASLRVPPDETIPVVLRDAGRYRSWKRSQAAKILQPPGDRLFICGACEGTALSVDAYGCAHPCLGLYAPELSVDLFHDRSNAGEELEGKGKVNPIQQAIDRFSHLSEMRAKNPEYLERCARCFLKGICKQCPAKSWTEHGTLDKPVEYLCDVAHAWARHEGWLAEGERAWEITDWLERFPE